MKISTQIETWTRNALEGKTLSSDDATRILTDTTLDVMDLIHAAYQVRKEYWGKEVRIHVLNNAQNGSCPEDCSYCVQAKTSEADIEKYPAKEKSEILAEAKRAYENGAHRYCMVYSGRGPRQKRVAQLADIIKSVKSEYNIEVCLSPGLIGPEDAKVLADAGLDRFNHNLNTSESYYEKICTTHTFEDRLNTLQAVRNAGIQMCSGMIVGMGETPEDVVEVAQKLRELEAESVPVNFYMPISGNKLGKQADLNPEYCLRVLAMFRFAHPKAELRVAAGREMFLRSMQPFALMAANSLFMDGYLNTVGTNAVQTLRMIKDMGFEISADQNIDDILEQVNAVERINGTSLGPESIVLKGEQELRPRQKSCA
ncbi:MAG: biotin synthase BioB [bacterium]|nr:biotin synthase BioB [bacterium]